MQRPRLQSLLVWTLACWQVVLLVICVPAASARPAPEPTAAAHACCDDGATTPTEQPQSACPHCSDGQGRFVDGPSPVLMLAPDALVARAAIPPRAAASDAGFADERPVYRPPDPSLYALRCALVR